jgi:NAD(P)-dependent dehydrogenase (short-subunit alcohol dehydrogenase family)
MTKSLQDRVAIVTGGAMGIGGATARRLAEEGARVLIADFNPETAQANVERIRRPGGVADAITADVSQTADIQRMVEQAVALWGRLDILVNNAWSGRSGKGGGGSALTVKEEEWHYGMDVMVKALWVATRHAIPHMEKTGNGSIVNIASVHGLLMAPGALTYETAKAAVIGMSRQMACDFGPLGVRVNTICPGHIVTENMQARKWDHNPSLLPLFEQQYPVRRVGKPEDIANGVRFLCSDEASFITGHTLVIDGGLSIQLQENLSLSQARFYRDHPGIDLDA